jgi:glycosyltransferase involved in cell wall biosynthesis
MRRLHEERGSQVVLDLVGFFDDDYETEVNQLVADGIAVFHGFQSDPCPYYAATDCVVLPSYHEGMSNVLLEASATGRPVITSNIHGCKEAVIDGKTGLLCSVKDTDDLLDKMRRMAELPRDERDAMGKAARAKMEQEFEKSLIVGKTLRAILD